MKKIKKSIRGLTFSTNQKDVIGNRYHYVVDKKEKQVLIIPDANGPMTVSRKKAGKEYKPLYDIRSKEVKELCASADYMEVDVQENRIVVSVIKAVTSRLELISGRLINNLISINDIIGKKTGEIILDCAVGNAYPTSLFGKPTLNDNQYFEYLSNCIPKSFIKEKRKEIEKVYDVVSLFSGAGLLDYSFKDPQFKFVYAVDFDKDACETYRKNIGEHIRCKDIRDVNSSEVPNSDLIIGGPCCQGYSNSNRANIQTDAAKEKRLLIEDYVRIVCDKKPKVFVIENVPQFLTKEHGLYLRKVTDSLKEYEITSSVITDSKVGGFTSRKRAIVIGSRIGKIELPDAVITTVKTVRDALKNVDATWFNYKDVSVPRNETELAMSYVQPGHNWKDVPSEIHTFDKNTHSDRFRRLSWDEIAPTIVNWRKICMMPPEGNRILNVSEAAALMGMDKSFHILGSTLNSKQQQISNGVTQAIGKFVKKYVLNALNNDYKMVEFAR